VLVNQRIAPDDFTADGSTWEQLSVVDVTTSTLVVKLGSTPGDGYAIADAVRIERVEPLSSEPEIAVLVDSRNIADEIGRASFGTTQDYQSVTKTFTVVNTGATVLLLSGGPTVPAGSGFSLVEGFTDFQLSQGESTTFKVKLDAAAAGNYSAQITFTSDDSDEGEFNFTVTGTVLPVDIIDCDSRAASPPLHIAAHWRVRSRRSATVTIRSIV